MSSIRQGTWTQFMERWESERCVEMRHSLLHFGFDIKIHTYEFQDSRRNGVYNPQFGDRVIFYLNIADGHSFWEREKSYEDYWLAQKAFTILCKQLFPSGFTPEQRRYDVVGVTLIPSWAETVTIDERIVQRLLSFFRLRKNETRFQVANLDDSLSSYDNTPRDVGGHHRATAREFAYDLTCFIRSFQYFGEYAGDRDNIIREMLDRHMTDALSLMVGLGRLDCLRNANAISDVSRAHLENLALSQRFWFHPCVQDQGESRLPTTLQEAAYAGSQLASALLLIKIMQRERERLEKIAELERKAQDTKKQLARLQQGS